MITTHGLNQLATHFENRVGSVLLNDSVKITEFAVEEVIDNVYTVEFDIPSEVTQITNLKIMDAEDVVLSTNSLFVPIEADTRFKYVLTLENEGRR